MHVLLTTPDYSPLSRSMISSSAWLPKASGEGEREDVPEIRGASWCTL
jgi:hypothetical protein